MDLLLPEGDEFLAKPFPTPFSQAGSPVVDQNSSSLADQNLQDDVNGRIPHIVLSWPVFYTTSKQDPPKLLNGTSPSDFTNYTKADLSMHRLKRMQSFLWFAGNVEERSSTLTEFAEQNFSIITTNQADMHIVTHFGKVYLKPLPDYLLCYKVWKDYICTDAQTYRAAYTMIFSYTNLLILSKTDLRIAHTYGLINEDISWKQWTSIVREMQRSDFRDVFPLRWMFGELRLARLNWISRFRSFRIYHSQDSRGWLVGTTVYVVLVLTAMQVGLSTTKLRDNVGFQRASFGFTVFSIVAPVIILFSRWTFAFLMAFRRRTNSREDPHELNITVKFFREAKEARRFPRNNENIVIENPTQI